MADALAKSGARIYGETSAKIKAAARKKTIAMARQRKAAALVYQSGRNQSVAQHGGSKIKRRRQ